MPTARFPTVRPSQRTSLNVSGCFRGGGVHSEIQVEQAETCPAGWGSQHRREGAGAGALNGKGTSSSPLNRQTGLKILPSLTDSKN